MTTVQRLEQEVTSHEVNSLNTENRIQQQCQAQINSIKLTKEVFFFFANYMKWQCTIFCQLGTVKSEAAVRSFQGEINCLQQDIIHYKARIEKLESRTKTLEIRCERKEENVLEEMLWYIELCKSK